MKKILIIEDDKGISESLKIYLENSNYNVFLYFEGGDAINEIKKISPDLLILDINLPKKDGITITKELREYSNIPIIMLTARTGELDKIKGLEIGADDYIAKPFSPRELLARINTILRRVINNNIENNNKSILKCENIKIDIYKKIVSINDVQITMTSNEYYILKKLISEKGKIVTRKTIMKQIIGYDKYIYDRTIDTHIKNIRKKINKKDFILTIRGEGYRINI